MSSYYNYRFRTHGLIRAYKKQHGTSISEKAVWHTILSEYDPYTGDIMGVVCMAEECVALSEKPNFLFIDNLKLAKAIQRSKFQSKALSLDEGIRFVSFPKGFQIENKPAQGVMFAWGSYEARKLWLNTMQVNSGSELTGYTFPKNVGGYVSFTYNSPHKDNLMCRLQIPIEKLSEFVAAESIEEMQEILEHQHTGVQLDSEAHKYQLKICHMTLKTLVYEQAMPDKVVNGCPDKRAGDNKFKPVSFILKAPSSLNSSSAPSVVGYFFRQLSHEKYYKGKHKHKAHGSRWVFVAPYDKGMTSKTINT